MKKLNLTGQKYGRLLVIEEDPKKGRKVMWHCLCECGKKTIVATTSLRSGHTTSCGCLRNEKRHEFHKIHGMAGTRIYKIWQGMKQRCYSPNTEQYPNYGGRGITICEEWLNFQKFYEWAISNGYKENLSIERIEVNGNYEPSNCKWATMKEQQNNRRNNHRIAIDGENHTIAEWSDITGIKYKTLSNKIYRKNKS